MTSVIKSPNAKRKTKVSEENKGGKTQNKKTELEIYIK